MIDLSRAVVCLNDDVVFDVEDRQCPRCASEGFVPLWRLLGRIREEVEV